MERSKFLNYLISKGIKVVNLNDDRDRVIDLYNPKNDRTAHIVIDYYDDYIEWRIITMICARLGVEIPPK